MMKVYDKEDINILWQPDKCIHCGVCFKGLSEVFDPREKPWIRPENATKERIIEQVKLCPSGAISIQYPTKTN
jgi:uncharacterized Fe-S cluster protein YjdI